MVFKPENAIDYYKSGHVLQYPTGTTLVYSNFTPRSDKLSPIPKALWSGNVTFFGLQYFLKNYLMSAWQTQFFDKPKDEVLARYKRRMDNALGEGAVPMGHIAALHDLGYLPLEIRALPEGAQVPIKVPVLTIWNTHPKHFWLTNYIESVMSDYLWFPITSATIAHHYRLLLTKWAEKTGAPQDFVQFQAHDFSFRGQTSPQSAAMSGAAHLASFVGTDTVLAIDLIEDFYNGDSDKELIGCSVPATEHSVMCMGSKETEIQTFKRLVCDLYPAGIISIVSDTWDFWKVITEYAQTLKPEIMARQGKVVFRPDSGDPVKIICGSADVMTLYNCKDLEDAKEYAREELVEAVAKETPHGEAGEYQPSGYFRYEGQIYKAVVEIEWNRYDKQYYYIDGSEVKSFEPVELTPAEKGAVECLWNLYGGTTSEKGFKVLDEHVGLIYGDSITLERAEAILSKLAAKGFASNNIVFGVGSFTYQYVTRDSFGFAIKSTYGEINGYGVDIFKDPITDDGVKKSARGRIKVTLEDGKYCLTDGMASFDNDGCQLVPVFRDGKLLVDHTIAEIRARISGE